VCASSSPALLLACPQARTASRRPPSPAALAGGALTLSVSSRRREPVASPAVRTALANSCQQLPPSPQHSAARPLTTHGTPSRRLAGAVVKPPASVADRHRSSGDRGRPQSWIQLADHPGPLAAAQFLPPEKCDRDGVETRPKSRPEQGHDVVCAAKSTGTHFILSRRAAKAIWLLRYRPLILVPRYIRHRALWPDF
jgi:hypothetical protein